MPKITLDPKDPFDREILAHATEALTDLDHMVYVDMLHDIAEAFAREMNITRTPEWVDEMLRHRIEEIDRVLKSLTA